jgi:shikimate dehydrogenase
LTDKYAVIGNPVAHSKSPQIHHAFAIQTGQDISFERILAPLDGFSDTVKRLVAEGYKGCSVTVPFKFDAYELATSLARSATSAQAVNTLRFNGSEVVGDNTDGTGLVTDITRNLGVSLSGKQVLLMGAGGAAAGVALPLLEAGALLSIANRDISKAEQLAARLKRAVKGNSYSAFENAEFEVVINATSSGLSDKLPPMHAGNFAHGALAYDLMYGRDTPFMQFARQHGAQVADGLGMLVEQAAEAFFMWRGVRPDTAAVIAQLRTA